MDSLVCNALVPCTYHSINDGGTVVLYGAHVKQRRKLRSLTNSARNAIKNLIFMDLSWDWSL